jgi:hypothetical protein
MQIGFVHINEKRFRIDNTNANNLLNLGQTWLLQNIFHVNMVRFLFKCTTVHSVHHICLHAVLYLKISNSEETEIPFQNVFSMRKILQQNTLHEKAAYYAVT